MRNSKIKMLFWAGTLCILSLFSLEALAQKETCKKCSFVDCLRGTIQQKEAMRDGYNELAKKWEKFWVKTDDGSRVPLDQVDLQKLYPIAQAMTAGLLKDGILQLRKDADELAGRVGAPAGCGYNPTDNLEMSTNSITCEIQGINKAQESMPCKEIYESALRHETSHLQKCQQRKGKKALPTVIFTPAGQAKEEAAAYSQEIADLKKLVKELKCGYQASGHVGDLNLSGTICDLGKPFTVNGSIINYQFNFTPSSPTTGTFKVSAAGLSVTVAGGGTYTIEGADSDRPRILTNGSAVGHSPVGSKEGGGQFYIDLTPLGTNECGQK